MAKQLRIGVTSKVYRKDITKLAKELETKLSGKCKLSFKRDLAKHSGFKGASINFKKPQLDIIISIGGDGTVLDTARQLSGHKTAILGIKRGGKGFLTEIQDGNLDEKLDALLTKKYFIEKRMKLNVKVNNKQMGEVLNDVVISTTVPGRIQHFALEIHTDSIDSVSADGIIVATPTGSTAYSLSAGGPIIEPTVEAYEITPICPFRLNPRSIVIPSQSQTKIRLTTNRNGIVILDGDKECTITKEDVVQINKSKNRAYFVKFDKKHLKRVRSLLS